MGVLLPFGVGGRPVHGRVAQQRAGRPQRLACSAVAEPVERVESPPEQRPKPAQRERPPRDIAGRQPVPPSAYSHPVPSSPAEMARREFASPSRFRPGPDAPRGASPGRLGPGSPSPGRLGPGSPSRVDRRFVENSPARDRPMPSLPSARAVWRSLSPRSRERPPPLTQQPTRPGIVLDRLLQTVPGGGAAEQVAAADRFWQRLCSQPAAPPRQVIREVDGPMPKLPGAFFDVVILGGTLGIVLAAALQRKGLNVAVVERNALRGRDQEWNISRSELQTFVDEGILTAVELEDIIAIEFNPVRVAFEGISDIVTYDVLNCGVRPARLVDVLRAKFEASGGTVLEWSSFEQARVHADGVAIDLTCVTPSRAEDAAGGAGGAGSAQYRGPPPAAVGEQVQVGCKVVVDALGGFSPIAAQARGGRKPDSVVLMVGSCAQGLPEAGAADLLYCFQPLNRKRGLQYFWETFPAADGLTTYMFCYCDAVPGRATIRQVFEDYIEHLPKYRGVANLDKVTLRRAVCGVVPNWHDSPLAPAMRRLLHIGDSAGNRSALSFAGFGAMARHLPRLRQGLVEALDLGLTDAGSLRLLQPFSPALSLTAAMQFSMGTRSTQELDFAEPRVIQNYIGGSFRDMQRYGPLVYRAFMQDYLQWGSMLRVVGGQALSRPGELARMTKFMAAPEAGQMFARSLLLLGWYDLLWRLSLLVAPVHEALLPPGLRFRWRRLTEAFRYGSSNDYKDDVMLEEA